MGRKISQPGTGETRACKAVRLDQGSQQLKEIPGIGAKRGDGVRDLDVVSMCGAGSH